ncbi:hypothetical protein [Pontibaca salina]|uniref:Uncharacterized protein n=1 Tax=Pontibaca salina TaxID=2795731 RepID=A0A934HMN3_9RHOB|nr:hypothetical protein [Pontibaca salina]MBI6629731.1 hypothetical protein [Pontibaca salina]
MTDNTIHSVSVGDMSAEELAHLQAQLDGPSNPNAQRNRGFQPHAMPATRQEVTISNGQFTNPVNVSKSTSPAHITATVPTINPGMIHIPGFGETTVEAAKAGGFLPQSFKAGDPSPFDVPAQALSSTSAGNDATNSNEVDQNDDEKGENGEKEALSDAERIVSKAGEVLDSIDQAHGAEVTDQHMNDAVEAGDYDADNLPEGVTPAMAEQVMQGYIAQADNTLSEVGSSVSALQETLTDDELRQARRATLDKNTDELQRLGKLSIDRLVSMPERDPEGFLELLDGMSSEDRALLVQDKKSGEWRLKSAPGQPEVSFGAAVRIGFIKL